MIPRSMPVGLRTLSPEQEAVKRAQDERKKRFQARLAHVMSHEQAHKSAGGRFAGSIVINADESTGHVSGHVPIQMDFGKTADEAVANARVISGAAKAPADPSSQDNAVAAAAMSIGMSLYHTRKAQEDAMRRQRMMEQIGRTPSQNATANTARQNPFAVTGVNPFQKVGSVFPQIRNNPFIAAGQPFSPYGKRPVNSPIPS